MILADFLISSSAGLIYLPILAVSVSAKAGATIMNRCGQADICYRGDSPNMMVMIMSLMGLKFLMKGCCSIIYVVGTLKEGHFQFKFFVYVHSILTIK